MARSGSLYELSGPPTATEKTGFSPPALKTGFFQQSEGGRKYRSPLAADPNAPARPWASTLYDPEQKTQPCPPGLLAYYRPELINGCH